MEQFHTVIKPFGLSTEGEAVSAVVPDNGIISCEVLSFGATLRSLTVPDGTGGAGILSLDMIPFRNMKPMMVILGQSSDGLQTASPKGDSH